MDPVSLIIFLLTYLGLAIGRIPGLGLDRTGIAVLGGAAMVAFTPLSLAEAQASVHAETIAVLFGMMMLSAQFRLSGLYTRIADRTMAGASGGRLLVLVMVVAALLSAVLTNDVVCFALAPLVCGALIEQRRNPVPYLLALAMCSNIGSALTPIGNPQNIYIAQKLGLDFGPFVLACAVPVMLTMLVCWLMLRKQASQPLPAAADTLSPAVTETARRPFVHFEAGKAVILAVAALVLFLIPSIPAAYTALGIAGLVLLSRKMRSQEMLALVDWQLLAMFVGIFVVSRGMESAGWTALASSQLNDSGIDLSSPAVAAPVVAVLSNVVSNVPAVVMIEPYVGTDASTGHLLALASTFAGNALIVGSIANIIVVEQAKKCGVQIGNWAYAQIGIPLTMVSLVIALLWAWIAW